MSAAGREYALLPVADDVGQSSIGWSSAAVMDLRTRARQTTLGAVHDVRRRNVDPELWPVNCQLPTHRRRDHGRRLAMDDHPARHDDRDCFLRGHLPGCGPGLAAGAALFAIPAAAAA